MQPDTFYHVYNHANGSENLFREKKNYYFFLEKWAIHIEPVASTCAYCLMPNHIHFLVRIHPEEVLNEAFRKFKTFGKLGTEGIEFRISKSFGNLFSSYTQSFNKEYNRKGSLFIPKFKRNEVGTEEYLTTIVHYIHHNPIHHGFGKNYGEWPFSSYQVFLTDKPTKVNRELILDWFGGKDGFLKFHELNIRLPETTIMFDE